MASDSERKDAALESVFQELAAEDDETRTAARETLVSQGEAAIPSLVAALCHEDPRVRFQAAKGLETLKDPRTAAPLTRAIADEDADVQWVAGEALGSLGEAAIAPLLDGVVHHSGSHHFRQGAHHALKLLIDAGHTDLEGVREALDGAAPPYEAPVAASRVQMARTKLG